MKRILLVALAVALMGACWTSVRAADQRTREAMKQKLTYAQSILEGIALEDYQLIESNAVKLRALSQSSGWSLRTTPEYQRHTADFTRQSEALIAAAQKQNVDGATLAYFNLTSSCVACHRHLRGADQAGFRLPQLEPGEVRLAVTGR